MLRPAALLALLTILLAADGRGADYSLLVVDLDSGRVLRTEGPRATEEMPLASLVKPFLFAAWARGHSSETVPVFTCAPSSPMVPPEKSCWDHRGHGTVGLKDALAFSCNRYFSLLAETIEEDQFIEILDEAGIPHPETLERGVAALVNGTSDEIRANPLEIVRGLDALVTGLKISDGGTRVIPLPGGFREVLRGGMAAATTRGTASAVGGRLPGEPILSKTGTWKEGGIFTGAYVGLHEGQRIGLVVIAPGGRGPKEAADKAAEVWAEILDREKTKKFRVGLLELSERKDVIVRSEDEVRVWMKKYTLHTIPKGGLFRFHGDGRVELERIPLEPPLEISGSGIRVSAELGDRMVTGTLRISRTKGRWRIVAMVPEDELIAKALSGEMAEAPAEALEAASVVIRTFLRSGSRHKKDGFDFCDNSHCLRLLEPDARHRAATESTRGRVLRADNGRLRENAFLHANCGGGTSSPNAVWKGKSGPSAVAADPKCEKEGTWSRELWIDDLEEALGERITKGAAAFSVERRDSAGRALLVRWNGRVRNAEEFRLAIGRKLGWDTLPSSKYTVTEDDGILYFEGSGRGHGVGFCEEGAMRMAGDGASAEEILRRYFPPIAP